MYLEFTFKSSSNVDGQFMPFVWQRSESLNSSFSRRTGGQWTLNAPSADNATAASAADPSVDTHITLLQTVLRSLVLGKRPALAMVL